MVEPDTLEEQRIVRRVIDQEMKQSYLAYSMSVIVRRALPDVRDGLKPVHRRILYAMNDLGMLHNKPFKKCARIVGEVLGKYHPHGDTAVYDSLVRMAQNFSLRYPLIQGQGNFGSIDGDRAAAMRYCITGDSLILTDRGILPIRNISDKKESRINMKILSYNGKKNSASKFFNSGKHSIIELKTKLGYKIRGSYNHPVMCWTLRDNIPQIEWKLLENINKTDIILLNRNSSLFAKNDLKLDKFKPKLSPRTKKFEIPKVMNKDLAFLLGALVAEGSFHQGKILFSNSDMAFYSKVKDIIYDQFEGIQLYERKIAGNCLELNIYHKYVVDFLKNIGFEEERSHKKEIPFSVLQSSKKIIVEFLKALFEGDGSVSYKIDKRHNGKNMTVNYDSKSTKLIEQLKILLLNFGIVTTHPYRDKRNGCYKLIISGYNSIKKFKNEINFFSERKRSILANIDSINPSRMSKTDFIPYLSAYLRRKYKKSFVARNNFDRYNNLEKNYNQLIKIIDLKDKKLIDLLLKQKYLFNEVSDIIKPNEKEEVFSVKVNSKCHSFIANGFINHNTEARLNKLSEEMLSDIDKDTVDFSPNFDGSLKEPVVLPAKAPNLLINGSSGIAVGMATNIPPHNVKEVCSGTIALIDNPEVSGIELLNFVKGPDFPTGGLILGKKGIKEAYATGKGKIKVRAKISVEEVKNKTRIIVNEIPYMVNKAHVIEHIAFLVTEKKIQGISDIRDESDQKNSVRIVIELKKSANSDLILNQLYTHTRLQETFGIILLALVDGKEPKVLNLKQILTEYLNHRKIVVTRRTKFELDQAEARSHILEGLITALDHIDDVIKFIKKAKNAEEARAGLITEYDFSQKQAQAILDMKLQRLTSLEQEKLREEQKNLLELIAKLMKRLSDKNEILQIIKKELTEISEKYGDERRTQIIEEESEKLSEEELIKSEEYIVTITHAGYVKRLPMGTYKSQKRGGKGVIAAETKEEDFVENLFTANTHDYILFFTNKGKVHWLKVYQLPEAGRYAKGTNLINLIGLGKDENITAFIPVSKFEEDKYLFMATKKGFVKKTALSLFSSPRKGGIIALGLKENDSLIQVLLTSGEDQIMLATKKGMAARFSEEKVRSMGRTASGVAGIKLKGEDEVVGAVVADENKSLLTATENGFGKRTPIKDYRLISRGGVGVINIKITEKNGDVVCVRMVGDEDDIMFITQSGILLRMKAKGISVVGRNTQGVRAMRLKEGDKLITFAKIVGEE